MGTSNAPVPGSWSRLSEYQRQRQTAWLDVLAEQYLHDDKAMRKVGLWVNGDRRSGTTYTASVAVKQAVRVDFRDRYGIYDWEYLTASELNALIRLGWDSYTQKPMDDFDLFTESTQTEVYLGWLWHGCDLLWIDDLQIGSTDMTFFAKHTWPPLEERVKNGRATVISTSLTDIVLGNLVPVVKDLFVLCKCDRQVVDAER